MKRYLAELLVIMISSHGCSWNSDILNNEKFFVLRMHQKWHNFPQKSVFLSSNGKYQTCAHQTFSEDFLGPYLLEKRHLVGIQRLFIFSYFGDSLFLACGINLFFPCQKPIFHWNEKILGRITRYYDLFTWV